MVRINALLVSTGGGLDHSASPRNRTQFSYVDDGCLNSSRGVIFPGSHRSCDWRFRNPRVQALSPGLRATCDTLLGDLLFLDLELADDLLRCGPAQFHGQAPSRSGLLRPLFHPGLIFSVQVRGMGNGLCRDLPSRRILVAPTGKNSPPRVI